MKLNKVRLKNIRSYIEQEIEFPEGSTLLAGDIGSGKSSILLAIDFALFGLQRASLSGSSLLRNGTNNGFVELEFEIDNKRIIIKRTLKRSNNTVTQDSGYIIINNERIDLTPTELKQKVLELLNYPKELLTKYKSLIYRYTIYTPQEEMKSILLAERESRLNILRKVFGIDKYKRIKENSNIFINYLKQISKEIEGKISDLNNKKLEYEEKQKEIQKIKLNLNILKPELLSIENQIKTKKELLLKLEKDIKTSQELKNKFNLYELNIKNKKTAFETLKSSLEQTELKIKDLKEIKKPKVISEDRINELESTLKSEETIIKELNAKITEYKIKIESAQEVISKISSLNTCPLCKQQVTEEHIKTVKQKQSALIEDLNNKLENTQKQLKQFELKLQSNKNILETLKKEFNKYETYKLQLKYLEENKSLKEKIEQEILKIKQEITSIENNLYKIKQELNKFKNLEDDYQKNKTELEKLQDKSKLIEIEKTKYEKELEIISSYITNLKKEIKEKETLKSKLEKQKQLQFFLQNNFINIISIIEKKIMFKVHHDFNSLFQKWFDLIMNNELLKIKLDEEFTPVIEQAGHELDYEYLSGGEKTAAALAYRLSLNQVINSLISTIKTKDLLILDEPTDGFSSEQLDRIKLVLEQLEAKQIIIVSHESKIESFVDNIIKLNKEDHITQVIS